METALEADQIRQTVTDYLARVAAGDAAAIAELYADDATLTDPVGSESKNGRAAIAEFYGALSGAKISTELLTLRVAGASAAFHFRVVTDTGEQQIIIEPIDVMTFDEQGKITSMAAYWSPADVVMK
ncbi:SgcJ/EcaC family oxidoreductase [Jongsikchunia kroppenstedtii]|uniref:SgcJ/EcaC family oxidoreductase n=1 Tax=Jongsikchunia kroppenstedtii TaxID=1121721 RepID=UPI00036E9EA2|nr:SgcJ/EcaC family oxidoreductase [Jongsikchunia kroppenstedtii]